MSIELHHCETEGEFYDECYQEEQDEPFRLNVRSSIVGIFINKRVNFCPICGMKSPEKKNKDNHV